MTETKSSPPLSKVLGSEGPHTLVVTKSGSLFAFGTCHKGLLSNICRKPLLSDKYDELQPYEVGTVCRCCNKSEYDCSLRGEIVTSVTSAHIYCCALTKDGEAYSWGCGSGGRCGVEKFLTGLAGKRSRLKCYMSNPERVGTRECHRSSSHALTLENFRVLQISSSR